MLLRIPWNIPEDLKRFKTITLNHPVIVGKNTFLSFKKPLANRLNIVVSSTLKQEQQDHPNVIVVSSIDEAIDYCKSKDISSYKNDEVFIIGGAKIYNQTIDLVSKIYLTLVHKEIEADTFYPQFLDKGFKQIFRSEKLRSKDIDYEYITYQK